MTKLRTKVDRFFNFIRSKHVGDLVTASDLLSATGWTKVTLETHERKNALAPFLQPIGGGKYRVRRDGGEITANEIREKFTQIRPVEFQLSAGLKVKGQSATYELVEELGRGAVGHVWKATKIIGGAVVAVKLLNPRPDLLDPKVIGDVTKRFAREAKNGLAVKHPNIIPYVDLGEYDGHPFLVMEYASGMLSDVIATSPLTIEASLEIIATCATGLRHLAASNSPHRDVKPDNILLYQERYVLGDLGVVKWSDMNPAFKSAGSMTKESMRLGSWYYMAPEQRIKSHDATPASDIYALGMSWYEMLTGDTPDPTQIVAGDYDPPSANVEINEFIGKMLKYKASERPTIDEVLEFVEKKRAKT